MKNGIVSEALNHPAVRGLLKSINGVTLVSGVGKLAVTGPKQVWRSRQPTERANPRGFQGDRGATGSATSIQVPGLRVRWSTR
jgi:hypothetical protein